MKIAHITDLHCNDFMSSSENLNALTNLENIAEDLVKRKIRKVIFTGDYGKTECFDSIVDLMNQRDIEYEYVLGNHDDYSQFADREDLQNRGTDEGIYYSYNDPVNMYIFLDSSSGSINGSQVEFLKEHLAKNKDRRVLVFLHHPVLDCGFTLMDRMFPLKNRDEVAKIFFEYSGNIYIFCGHYHNEHTVMVNNVKQYVTLSSLLQLKKYSDSIEVESLRYGYRIIDTGNIITADTVEF